MISEADTTIAVRGLSKNYGDVRAVDDIDLTIRKAEVYGFVGRNGAGKTTTIRMLLGLIRPTKGDVEILNTPIEPGVRSVFARVGFLVETAAAYPNLTVEENLDVQRRLTGAPRGAVVEAIALLGLERYANRRAGHLSLGNKQRLALARALLHHPAILILDEPANGLDPAGIAEIRQLLRRLADERGVTVFVSSHILSELAQIADRIGIIHDGRIIEDLTMKGIRSRSRRIVEVAVSDPDEAARLLAERLKIKQVERQKDGVLRVSDGADRTSEIARVLVDGGLDLTRLCTVEEDLEDYFMRLTDV